MTTLNQKNEKTGITTKRITRVRDSDYGLYVWERPNGKLLASTDGDVLNVEGRFGDILAIAEITKAAAYWGYPEGRPVFRQGDRLTDEEWEEHHGNFVEGNL